MSSWFGALVVMCDQCPISALRVSQKITRHPEPSNTQQRRCHIKGWVDAAAEKEQGDEAMEREVEREVGEALVLVEWANRAEREASNASCDSAPPPMRSD